MVDRVLDGTEAAQGSLWIHASRDGVGLPDGTQRNQHPEQQPRDKQALIHDLSPPDEAQLRAHTNRTHR
jgi:hypothetical protein